MTTESLLVITPYYLTSLERDFDLKIIAFIISVSLFLVIPTSLFFIGFLSKKLRDRRILLFVIIACIIFNFFIMDIFYVSLTAYCIMFVLLIISSNLLENVASTMFSKIIPSDYEILKLNAGFVINVFTTTGRILGALILTMCGGITAENLNIIVYSITTFLFFLVLIVTIIFYSNLRVKAIARILRSRSVRKHKPAEF